MHSEDLRRRVGAILAAEASEPPDWYEVDRLSDELLGQLIAEPDTACPEIVSHYLDDADIRRKDESYACPQRQRVGRFVETGTFEDSTPIPLWSCAVALALIVAAAVWFVW